MRSLLAVLAALAAAAAACRDRSTSAESSLDAAIPVETVEVGLEAVVRTVRAVGSLAARQAVVIKPEAGGVVQAIEFREGGEVAEGTVLVRLDDSKLAAERALAHARVESARARLANAAERFRRAKALLEQKVLSRQEFDDAEAENRSAEAGLREAEAAARLADRRLADMTIRAPFAGIAGKRLIHVGDVVENGRPLVDLVDLEGLELVFAVPETFVADLAVGQAVEVGVSSLLGTRFSGEVFFVAPQVDPVNRTVDVKARIANQGRRLRPGQFAEVRLVLERKEEVPVIPEEALVSREGRFFVFEAVNGSAREREVTLGERLSGRVAVTAGLEGGETIVRSGHQKLHDGAPIAAAES